MALPPTLPEARHYMLVLNCGSRSTPNERIEALFSHADWLRFNSSTYFIVSYIDIDIWHGSLRSLLHPEDSYMFVRINPVDRLGFVPPVVIDWFTLHGG
jgi:hypothetical protein